MTDALYTKIVSECVAEDDFYELIPMVQNEPLLDIKLEERIAEFKQPRQTSSVRGDRHQWHRTDSASLRETGAKRAGHNHHQPERLHAGHLRKTDRRPVLGAGDKQS